MNAIPCAMAESHQTKTLEQFGHLVTTRSSQHGWSQTRMAWYYSLPRCKQMWLRVLRARALLSNKDGSSKVVCLKILHFDGSGSTKLFFECKCFLKSLAYAHLQASLSCGQTRTAGSARPVHSLEAVLSPQDSVQPTASAKLSLSTSICEQDQLKSQMLALIGAQPLLSTSWRSHSPSSDTCLRCWHLHHVIGMCPST